MGQFFEKRLEKTLYTVCSCSGEWESWIGEKVFACSPSFPLERVRLLLPPESERERSDGKIPPPRTVSGRWEEGRRGVSALIELAQRQKKVAACPSQSVRIFLTLVNMTLLLALSIRRYALGA